MKIYKPNDEEYAQLLTTMDRYARPNKDVSSLVEKIIEDVAQGGDEALLDYTQRFDGVQLTKEELRVSDNEIKEALSLVSQQTKDAISATLQNIHYFASNSLRKDWSGVNAQGAEVGERFLPFDRVGIYIPGGKAPLVSTALMTGGFAQAAGVHEIVAMTPCGKNGKVNPALLYALTEAGATEIYKVGGAQAIAALALGTESIRSTPKVFGPGNRFVVEAKRQLVGSIDIDLLPGPSEVMVLADESANPAFIAADLLAQAEHGSDSVVVIVTDSEKLLGEVEKEITEQANKLSRGEIIRNVLDENAYGVLVPNIMDSVELANDFAPEHIVITVQEDIEADIISKIHTAGAIYAGTYSTVACGDFLAGPSHTLPTGGAGKFSSGLRADQFQRRTSIVRMDQNSAKRSAAIVNQFAELEGLDAHGWSLQIRCQ